MTAANAPPRPTAVWHVVTAAWAILAAPMSASLVPPLLLAVAAVFFGGVLGLIWSVQLLRVLLDPEARGRLNRRAAFHWAVLPAAGLLVSALVLSRWPYAARVKLSEPALLRLADEVGAGRVVDPPIRAGLITVDAARREGPSVLLYTDHGYFRSCGLAYSRDGPPPGERNRGQRYRPLFGRWYVFEEPLDSD